MIRLFLLRILNYIQNPYIKFNNEYYYWMFINKLIVAKTYESLSVAIKDKKKLFNLYKELFSIIGKNNKYIIDCGANIGYRASIFDNVTTNKIYCFEPFSAYYLLLKRNFKNNKNFKLFNYGLSNRKMTRTMGYPARLASSNIDFGAVSYIDPIDRKNKSIEVELVDLVNFKSIYKKLMDKKDIVFVKIDVQGDEENIFKSMNFLLEKTSFEIEVSPQYGFNFDKLVDLIKGKKYSIYVRANKKQKKTSKNDYYVIPSIYNKKIQDSKLYFKKLY